MEIGCGHLQDEEFIRQVEALQGDGEPIAVYLCISLPDTTMIHLNQNLADRWNRTPEELTGKRWIDFLSDEERKYARGKLTQMTPDKPIVHLENAVTMPDGDKLWTHWVNRGIFEGGELVRFEAVGVAAVPAVVEGVAQ